MVNPPAPYHVDPPDQVILHILRGARWGAEDWEVLKSDSLTVLYHPMRLERQHG